VGGLTLSNFTLPDVLSLAASPIDAGAVLVTPVGGTAGAGLRLAIDDDADATARSAAAGTFQALRLGFDVQGGITGALAALLGPVAIGDAAITLVTDFCLGAGFLDATNLVCAAPTQNLIAIAIDGFADNPVGTALGSVDLLGVVAEIGIDAGPTGSATLAGSELRFLQAAAVPSPSSLALLLLGATVAAGVRSMARRSASA
jgi:hypothetical protein